MKITKIEVIRNTKPIPLPGSWRPAWDEPDTPDITTMSFSIVKLHTDEGLVGIGPHAGPIPPLVERSLLGQDPAYIQGFFDAHMRGRGGSLGRPSVGGIEIALWDLLGKAAGLPIFKLLGACRDRVPAYAATAQLRTAGEYAEMAVEFRRRGIRAIKLRMHRPDPADDLAVVRAVRAAVGDAMEIMVDANQNNVSLHYPYWTLRTAIRVAEELEELGVYWLEEPRPRSDLEGLAEMAERFEMYIAGGEHSPSIYEFRDALWAGAYDIAQPDVTIGQIGISGLRIVSVLADATGRLIAPHVSSGGTNGLHLAAALQAMGAFANGPYVEYKLDLPVLTPETSHLILTEPILIGADGCVPIPDKPGLGIELNEEVIARYV